MFSVSMFVHIHWHFLKGSLTVPGRHIAHKTDFLEKSALFVAVSTCMFKGASNFFASRQWVRNTGRPAVCKKVHRSHNTFLPGQQNLLFSCHVARWMTALMSQRLGWELGKAGRHWEVLLWRVTCALPRVSAGSRGNALPLGYLSY